MSMNLSLGDNRTTMITNNTSVDSHIQFQISMDRIVSKFNLISMVFGTFGNLICILVLCNKDIMRKKYHYYLLSLAFSDFCFCFIIAGNYVYFEINPPNVLYDLHWFFCYYLDYVYKSFDSVGVILTLIASIDRTYAVRNPMDLRNFVTHRFPKTIAIVATILVFLTRSIENLFRDVTFQDEFCENQPVPSQPFYIIHIICDIILTLVLNFVPALIIMLLNFYLWHFIVKYKKTASAELGASSHGQQRRMSKSQKSHYITIIMIGIWLLLTSIPYHLFCFYYKIYGYQNSYLFMAVQGVTSAFFNLNRCLNIFIYTCFHSDFQKVALKYLRCCIGEDMFTMCSRPCNKNADSATNSECSVISHSKFKKIHKEEKSKINEEYTKPMLMTIQKESQ